VIGAAAVGSRRGRVPTVVVGAIATAWAVAIAAQLTGTAGVVHHDALVHAHVPLWAAAGIFVVAWQLMIAAMMLPSSVPLVRSFRMVSAAQPRPDRALGSLLAGYAVVWSAFGLVAFVGDVGVHRLVHGWAWLGAHDYVIAGSVLVIAGAFQFSDLKDRCLSECRHPGPFLLRHYGRGVGAAYRLGVAHGKFCLGCCWALMLVGFAAGVANLWWMAALTAVMVAEKTSRNGDRLVRPIGFFLVGTGALVFATPSLAVFGAG
jgi:predicted metal-binding membrane protein